MGTGAGQRGVWRRLLAAGLAVAFALFVIELLLRVFLPLHFAAGYIGAYEYDPEVGTRLKSDLHHLETSDFLEEVRTNRLGTVNFQDSFEGYDRLVFAIGDSFTQGTGVPSDASYPFQLDLALNLCGGRYERRFGVVNLGLASFGMLQSLLVLERYRESLGTPDFVLYLGTSNDWSDDRLFESGYRHRHLVDGSPHFGALLGPLQWLGFRTELGKRAKVLLGRLRRGGTSEGAGGSDRVVAARQEPLFEALRERSRELGATLIVSWSDVPDDPRENYAWLRGWAQRSGVPFADWHARVESVRDAIPAAPVENPHSGGHLRGWVYTMVAEAFADHVAPERCASR